MGEELSLDWFFAKNLLGKEAMDEQIDFLASIVKRAREGHLCIEKTEAPALPPGLIEEGVALIPKAPIVRFENSYYLQKNWVLESWILREIQRLQNRKIEDAVFDENQLLNELNLEQKEAVRHLFANPFSILCGGPGTGKTFTAGVFLRLFTSSLSKQVRIALAAPTGKAALHLQSSLLKGGLPPNAVCVASTLHRLLDLRAGQIDLFSGSRVDFDIVVVDEASMMDVSLFAHLLARIGQNTRLILMGDPNQLPPIEETALFSECADLFGVILKKCMRTEDLRLQTCAKAILQGDEEAFFANVSVSEEFDERMICSLFERIDPIISEKPIDPMAAFEKMKKFRVLNAMRQGPFGLEAMNQKILALLDARCKEGSWWASPIMAVSNSLELSNGSMGVLIGQKKGGLRLSDATAYFEETGEKCFPNPPPYEVSFVTSVHKSQGSEFDEVVALLPKGSENFGKEILYTAATRARKSWEVVGEKETVAKLLKQRSRPLSGFTKRFLLQMAISR